MTLRGVGSALAVLVAMYVLVGVVVWALQGRILYVGAFRGDDAVPPDGHAVTYKAADGTPVHTLEFANPGAFATLVYFHGNGEVVGDDVPIARELVRSGFWVILVEYRGYGRSKPGTPGEQGFYADAEAVLDGLVARNAPPARTVLWGQSLGTGVAVEMAARGKASALALISPYTSMADVAAVHFPWLPVRWLLRDRFDSLGKAGRINVPTLVVHGTDDEVVPFEMGRRLAAAIPGAELVSVAGAHHNDVLMGIGGSRAFDRLASLVR